MWAKGGELFMFSLLFRYENNSFQEYSNIKEVFYRTIVDEVTVTGEDIFKHRFPLDRNLHLYSDESSYIISAKGLKEISVTRE